MNRGAVLAYHGIPDSSGFERNLANVGALARVIPATNLVKQKAALSSENGLPIVLTVDDLYSSHIQYGGPILNTTGLGALVFAVGESLA